MQVADFSKKKVSLYDSLPMLSAYKVGRYKFNHPILKPVWYRFAILPLKVLSACMLAIT